MHVRVGAQGLPAFLLRTLQKIGHFLISLQNKIHLTDYCNHGFGAHLLLHRWASFAAFTPAPALLLQPLAAVERTLHL